MSTILKALEKVEEEERLGRSPGEAEPGPAPESAAPAEPAPQEERRLPWRGALVGAAVVTFTLGLVWLWTPEQTEQEVAQAAAPEAQAAIRPTAEPTETAAVSSDPAVTVPAASTGNDPDELADSIASRLAAAVPDEPSAPRVSPPPAAKPPHGTVPPPAAEPPPLAVAAEIQPTAEGPTASPANIVRSAPSRTQPPVASRPAALPADPPPVQPDPTPAAPPPAARVASVPPPARVEPSPKPTPPAARPEPAPKPRSEPAPKPPAAKPRPTRVVTIPPAPTVHVARTVWHPSPDRRSARVEVEGFAEPLELKEGDAVGVLVVAEIQPSGVIFLHGGARLRHSVGK